MLHPSLDARESRGEVTGGTPENESASPALEEPDIAEEEVNRLADGPPFQLILFLLCQNEDRVAHLCVFLQWWALSAVLDGWSLARRLSAHGVGPALAGDS